MLVTQQGILQLLLALACFRNVSGGTDEDSGFAIFVAIHYREVNGEDVCCLIILFDSMEFQGLFLFLLGGKLVK